MEILDVVAAWQLEEGDLIQFEVYDEDGRYIELMRVESKDELAEPDMPNGWYIFIRGESLQDGGRVEYSLDPFLEVEVMGA